MAFQHRIYDSILGEHDVGEGGRPKCSPENEMVVQDGI